VLRRGGISCKNPRAVYCVATPLAWCRWRLFERMQTRWGLLIVGAPTPQEKQTVACLTVDTWSLPCRSWKRRFGPFLWFLLIAKCQNVLTVLITFIDVLWKDLISWLFWFFKMFWTYYTDHRALFVTAGLMFGCIVCLYSDRNVFLNIWALISDLCL